jgi:hypothetical protein
MDILIDNKYNDLSEEYSIQRNNNIVSVFNNNDNHTYRYEKSIFNNLDETKHKIAIFQLNPSHGDDTNGSNFLSVTNFIDNKYGYDNIHMKSFYNMYAKVSTNITKWKNEPTYYNPNNIFENCNFDYIFSRLHEEGYNIIFVAYGQHFTRLKASQWKEIFINYINLIKNFINEYSPIVKCFGKLETFDKIHKVYYPKYPTPRYNQTQLIMEDYLYNNQ